MIYLVKSVRSIFINERIQTLRGLAHSICISAINTFYSHNFEKNQNCCDENES